MQSTTSTNLSCNFNVLLPLAPAASTNQWPCSVHPCAGSACRVEIDRHTDRQDLAVAVIANKMSGRPHVPLAGSIYLHLNACWWIHLPQVPTARRRRPSTVGSQGVRASQDFLPMYSNGSFSSASRIPGTPCGYRTAALSSPHPLLQYITRYTAPAKPPNPWRPRPRPSEQTSPES